MPDDFTGTNSEKIDKLVAAVVEMRTTTRVLAAVVARSLPMLVSIAAWIVVSIQGLTVEIARTTERSRVLESLPARLDELNARLRVLEGRQARVPPPQDPQ